VARRETPPGALDLACAGADGSVAGGKSAAWAPDGGAETQNSSGTTKRKANPNTATNTTGRILSIYFFLIRGYGTSGGGRPKLFK